MAMVVLVAGDWWLVVLFFVVVVGVSYVVLSIYALHVLCTEQQQLLSDQPHTQQRQTISS